MKKSAKENRESVFPKELPALPPVGKYASRKEWQAACWQKIAMSPNLLELLVTSYERHNLVLRAAAIDGLAAGKSYRKIGEELWLSPQTISGIKKAVSEKSYRSYLERSKKERKKKVYSPTTGYYPKRRGTPKRTKYGTIYMP